MQLEVKIDSSYIEPKVIILTASMTEDVNIILNKLSDQTPQIISGSKDNKIEVIELARTLLSNIFQFCNLNHFLSNSISRLACFPRTSRLDI